MTLDDDDWTLGQRVPGGAGVKEATRKGCLPEETEDEHRGSDEERKAGQQISRPVVPRVGFGPH